MPNFFSCDTLVANERYIYICRSFALIVAHGLCSGLVCLCNISHERFGRRSLLVNRGLVNLMPRLAI